MTSRHVRGSLFVDYVRLIRARKEVDWSKYLEPEDFAFLREPIDDAGWYPTATFERFGLGILHAVANSSVEMVRNWGRFQVDAMLRLQPEILAHNSPRESLMRVVVHRKGFFDFDVLTTKEISDGHAVFELDYQMSHVAELAACMQTIGAFEELVTRAGGREVVARFTRRAWEADGCTAFEVTWSS
jgi:hypothetical protein